MSKGSLFVGAFSVVLIALFSTFSYLITTVNPPPVKPDMYRARKFGVEDVLYPNDALQPNDNVVYGLEKANYDVIEPHHTFSTLTTAYRRVDIPRTIGKEKTEVIWPKNYVTNCTKQQDREYKTTTQAMKLPVKGFRRSISEKAKVNNSNFLSLFFNLNNLDNHPRIMFEISNNKDTEKLRKYKYEDKRKIKLNLTNIGDNYNETIIELKENQTLIVKIIGNLIEFAKSFETNGEDTFIRTKSNKTSANPYGEFENTTDICDEHGFTFNLLNNTVKNESGNGNLTSDFNITLQTKSNNKTLFTFDSTMPFNSSNMHTIENLNLSRRINANELDESDKIQNSNDNVNDNLSTKGLVGLLIPEATATLPVNYHFINEA